MNVRRLSGLVGESLHSLSEWGVVENYNLGSDPFTNTWQHLAVTLKYSTKEVKIYVNGIPMSFTTTNVPATWTSGLDNCCGVVIQLFPSAILKD